MTVLIILSSIVVHYLVKSAEAEHDMSGSPDIDDTGMGVASWPPPILRLGGCRCCGAGCWGRSSASRAAATAVGVEVSAVPVEGGRCRLRWFAGQGTTAVRRRVSARRLSRLVARVEGAGRAGNDRRAGHEELPRVLTRYGIRRCWIGKFRSGEQFGGSEGPGSVGGQSTIGAPGVQPAYIGGCDAH